MSFDWGSIRADIKLYCINAFRENGNFPPDIERKIDDAIVVYKNIIDIEPDQFFLRGYGDKTRKALQDAFVDYPGTIASLSTVANCADTFLKLLLLYSRKATYGLIENCTLKPLAEKTGAFGTTVQSLHNVDPETLKHSPNNLYFLAVSYEARNINTHNSPGWDKGIVAMKLKYLIAFEIYCIIFLENELRINRPDLFIENDSKNYSPIDFRAYDLINFGKSAGELKNRIMQGVILHYISEKPRCETEIKEELGSKLNLTSASGCKRAVERLVYASKLTIEHPSGKYVLTQSELERLDAIRTNYQSNSALLMSSIKNLLKGSILEDQQTEVYEQIMSFLESYIRENLVTQLGADPDFNDDNSLFVFLKDRLNDEEAAKEMTKSLIEICKENTVLWKSAIGKVYTSMINAFPQPMECQRNVFIDTQVALYLLCMPYADFPVPDNALFRTCHELHQEIQKSKDLTLKFLKIYISEIAYHLKEALRMVFLEDYPAFSKVIPTNNVFYKYYRIAKKDNLLPETIQSFADYLEEIVSVSDEILDKRNADYILHAKIETALEDIGVTVESPEYYDEYDYRREKDCFGIIMTSSKNSKSPAALKNDAIMAHYLFEKETIPPSIFVTLDRLFAQFRFRYLEDYYNDASSHWLLFSPSRLINHLDLLKMDFDPTRLTDGVLTIINNQAEEENAQSIFSYVQHITEMKGVSQKGIMRRQKTLMAKIYNKELQEISESDTPDENYLTVFVETWNHILNTYSQSESLRQTYVTSLQDDNVFDSLIQLIDGYVKNQVPNEASFMGEVNALFADDKK